jgi:5'-AMP-activated protein kinase catalytic alpha subunit
MIVAIKIYEKFKLVEQSRKKSVIREILVLKKMQHTNILQLFDVIDSSKQLYLIIELAQGQNLF